MYLLKKKWTIGGTAQFKPVLFNSQLYLFRRGLLEGLWDLLSLSEGLLHEHKCFPLMRDGCETRENSNLFSFFSSACALLHRHLSYV